MNPKSFYFIVVLATPMICMGQGTIEFGGGGGFGGGGFVINPGGGVSVDPVDPPTPPPVSPNSDFQPNFSVDIAPAIRSFGWKFASTIGWKIGLVVAIYAVVNVWITLKKPLKSKVDKRLPERRVEDRVKQDFGIWALDTSYTWDDYKYSSSVRQKFYDETYL